MSFIPVQLMVQYFAISSFNEEHLPPNEQKKQNDQVRLHCIASYHIIFYRQSFRTIESRKTNKKKW